MCRFNLTIEILDLDVTKGNFFIKQFLFLFLKEKSKNLDFS